MSDLEDTATIPTVEEGTRAAVPEQHARVVGSPLPIGSGGSTVQAAPVADPQTRPLTPPPPGRALTNHSVGSPFEVPTGVQKAVSAMRAALPWVQRILPLLDGNIGMAMSNMLAPHHPTPPPQPPAPRVDLAPLEEGLAELHTQQRDLRTQLVEQNSSLKRVEDHLEMVREATDRNTLEQQELMEDLKSVGSKVNLFAILALGLLAISVGINVVLYLHILRVLP